MELTGIHHLTAVSAAIKENRRFYTQTLGMRLDKRSVNQDDVMAVIGMVMSESMWLVAIGVVLGLAAVLWAGRLSRRWCTAGHQRSSNDRRCGGADRRVTALAAGAPARRAERESDRGLAAAVGIVGMRRLVHDEVDQCSAVRRPTQAASRMSQLRKSSVRRATSVTPIRSDTSGDTLPLRPSP